MKKVTQKSGKAASPVRDPASPHGALTCTIDLDALRNLSLRELHALREGLHTTVDILCGLSCQPRFGKDNGMNYNGAGNILETIKEWLNVYEQAVVNIATLATPESGDDAEWRGHLLVGFAASLNDCLADVASVAATAARDEGIARFHDNHVRGAA